MCIVVDADLHVICLVVFCFAEFDGLFVMFFFFCQNAGFFCSMHIVVGAALYVQVFVFVVFRFTGLPGCLVGAVTMLCSIVMSALLQMSVAWSGDIKVHFDLLWSSNTVITPSIHDQTRTYHSGREYSHRLGSDVTIKRVLYSRL